MEQSIITQLTDGFMLFSQMINWLFIVVFIIMAWITNDSAEANNAHSWFSWYAKIPKVLRTLIFGILLALLFAWTFEYSQRLDVFKMLMSILLGMVVFKIGIEKALRFISVNVFKWDFTKK